MVIQFIQHIFADNVLLFCSLIMLGLFCVDLFGLLAKRFQFAQCRSLSFATTIVSIGLFATFVGVLIGLYGFESHNIASSVPKLLEGLRFAFAGSVLGMGLSLTLSILHKFLGDATAEESVLHSIDRKLGSMAETIRAPGQLIQQFNEMKIFLKEHLERINDSLDQALQQLAKGATQEVIQALERIIADFNNNLTVQFGDNFKELNSACARLIDWQRKYKEHVESAEQRLQQIMESLDQSCKAAQQLTEGNAKTQKVCQDVAGLMSKYDVQIQVLETHLKSCKELGSQAAEFLTSTQAAITRSADSLNSFSGVIESSVGKQSATLARLTEELDQQLPKALGELEDVLVSLTNQFAADYRSLFQYVTAKS